MEIRYNVTGVKRKELVKVIADATGARAEYKFMPTCNYEIDYFTVTKDGTLLFDDRADSEEVEEVLEAIAAAGFECEPQDGGEQPSGEETKEAAEVADRAPQEENVGLTVEIPLDKVAVGNLTSAQADTRTLPAATATAPGRLGTHRGASGNSRRTFPSQGRTSRNANWSPRS